MTAPELIAFLRRYRLGVVATRGADGAPAAAVVGVAITDELEIVFDTLADTRKLANLTADPRVAIVIGWDHEATAQLEGLADIPTGAEHERILAAYLAVFPDGRERLAWPGITHVRVTITWARYSDFALSPPRIDERTF